MPPPFRKRLSQPAQTPSDAAAESETTPQQSDAVVMSAAKKQITLS